MKKIVCLQELYQTLGITEDCEDEAVRLAFVYLAKRFHPDSGTPEANAVRFSEVIYYKNILTLHQIVFIII